MKTKRSVPGTRKKAVPRNNGKGAALKEIATSPSTGERQVPSPLRGILPTPPEVERAVERSLEGRPASPAARLRATEDFKMQYYFGGHWIAYRVTPEGYEVVTVGEDEICKLMRKLPLAERNKLRTWVFDPW